MSETIKLNIIQKGGMNSDTFDELFDEMIEKKNRGEELAEDDVKIIKTKLEEAANGDGWSEYFNKTSSGSFYARYYLKKPKR